MNAKCSIVRILLSVVFCAGSFFSVVENSERVAAATYKSVDKHLSDDDSAFADHDLAETSNDSTHTTSSSRGTIIDDTLIINSTSIPVLNNNSTYSTSSVAERNESSEVFLNLPYEQIYSENNKILPEPALLQEEIKTAVTATEAVITGKDETDTSTINTTGSTPEATSQNNHTENSKRNTTSDSFESISTPNSTENSPQTTPESLKTDIPSSSDTTSSNYSNDVNSRNKSSNYEKQNEDKRKNIEIRSKYNNMPENNASTTTHDPELSKSGDDEKLKGKYKFPQQNEDNQGGNLSETTSFSRGNPNDEPTRKNEEVTESIDDSSANVNKNNADLNDKINENNDSIVTPTVPDIYEKGSEIMKTSTSTHDNTEQNTELSESDDDFSTRKEKNNADFNDEMKESKNSIFSSRVTDVYETDSEIMNPSTSTYDNTVEITSESSESDNDFSTSKEKNNADFNDEIIENNNTIFSSRVPDIYETVSEIMNPSSSIYDNTVEITSASSESDNDFSTSKEKNNADFNDEINENNDSIFSSRVPDIYETVSEIINPSTSIYDNTVEIPSESNGSDNDFSMSKEKNYADFKDEMNENNDSIFSSGVPVIYETTSEIMRTTTSTYDNTVQITSESSESDDVFSTSKEKNNADFNDEMSENNDNIFSSKVPDNYGESYMDRGDFFQADTGASTERTTEYSVVIDHQTNSVTDQESSTFPSIDWTSADSSSEYISKISKRKVDGTIGTTTQMPGSTPTHDEITEDPRISITTTAEESFTTSTDVPPTSTSVTYATTTTTSRRNPSRCRDSTNITSFHPTIGKTELKINWTLESDVGNISVCHLKMKVFCNSTDDHSRWIVKQRSNSTDVNDYEPVSSLDHLSEFTNYSCTGQLMDTEDGSVWSSETFDVTTKPEVPSTITFRVKSKTASSFFLEWTRPNKIPGNFSGYYILIKNKGSRYMRDKCRTSKEESKSFFSKGEKYNFTEAEPNHSYEVQILAEDEAGNSTGIPQTISTESSSDSKASTAPLNVKSTLYNYSNNCNNDDYNTTLQLNWELPCNTNGELVKFQINISEVVHFDTTTSRYSGNNYSHQVPKNSNIENEIYQLVVENLNASCTYDVNIVAITENHLRGFPAYHSTERTRDGCPQEPSNISFYQHGSRFYFEWKEPKKFLGKILDYNVIISESGPKHVLSKDPSCPGHTSVHLNETTDSTLYEFHEGLPSFLYTCRISARTTAGIGYLSRMKLVGTPSEASDPIRNLEIKVVNETISYGRYEYRLRITFKEPCNTNGNFRNYTIEKRGRRYGFPDDYDQEITNGTSYELILKKPEYHYNLAVTVVTEMGKRSSVTEKSIRTNAGIPTVDETKIKYSVDEGRPTVIKLELEKDMFNDENGEVTHYALFLYEDVAKNSIPQKPIFGIFWNRAYPKVNKTTYPFIEAANIYQITAGNWSIFSERKHRVSVSIGGKDCTDNNFCHPLTEDTSYIVLLRGITNNTYRDVFISIKTGTRPSSVGLFLGIFFVLVVILLLGVYAYSRRPQYFTIRFRSIPNTIEDAVPRHLVAVKNFKSYYNKIQNDPNLLRKQYEEIDDETKKYKEENVHTTFALKPENKRKNRYTNILPYDEYRVKLKMDEDDEISSDYINASYIRGVSGKVEYIAAQGPLEHTCKDFWKMVIQENITVIVMVSLFVEKEKEKCFKYFPNNYENMMICEDLEVKCLTELQFDTYCVRTLLIRKDIKQYSVVHMQYLEWPDFGVPSGTHNMLSFCEEVRERIQIEKGLMAVHCSAGVGRTGTLISLDILLQTMRRKKEISVFECVMDLRKQRTHMVQTEKQYVYIHTCLKDVLENCSLYSFDEKKKNEEHIYQNITNDKVGGSEFEQRESAF